MKTRKQSPVITAPSASTKDAKRPVTTIEAKVDVGFGNSLFVRGQGAGMSWEHGLPMTCVDGQTWRWSGAVSDNVTFKVLLNDAIWAQGENIEAKPGQNVEVRPSF
jgi:hypothetical protein